MLPIFASTCNHGQNIKDVNEQIKFKSTDDRWTIALQHQHLDQILEKDANNCKQHHLSH
jgi:hypothetical protein